MFQAEYQFGCFSHQKKKRLEEERLLNCLEMPLFCFFSVSSFPVAINECLPIFLQLLTRDSGYESHVDRKWCDWYTDYTCPYRYIYIYTCAYMCTYICIYICISISPFPSCKIYLPPIFNVVFNPPQVCFYIFLKKRLDRVFLGPTLVQTTISKVWLYILLAFSWQ